MWTEQMTELRNKLVLKTAPKAGASKLKINHATAWVDRIAMISDEAGIDGAYVKWNGSPMEIAHGVVKQANNGLGLLEKLEAILNMDLDSRLGW